MSGVHPARVRALNQERPRDGAYVLYWMQQSQRAGTNHALERAARAARDHALPLIVGFGLMDGYPDANRRHYRFLLEGLRDAAARLRDRGIGFVVRRGEPDAVALELAADAALVVCDRGYLRHQRRWRERVAREAGCAVIEVEGDVVVPVDVASRKREYAARTLRPRIHEHLGDFARELDAADPPPSARSATPDGLDLGDLDALLDALDIDHGVPPVSHVFEGGEGRAEARLAGFIDERLDGYDERRGPPERGHVSHLSPYLHFGQISPLRVLLAARAAEVPADDRAAFAEELVVRRELAANYCAFERHYDAYRALPEWARETLAKHRDDEREHVYTRAELERAATHDPYWNAAMREMRYTGYMHNTMRMYWGKKIIEWTNTPKYAFRVALDLNNRYFLDGRDPSSYANVGWLFGLHDRPWQEREIFGTVRWMSAGGLERKFDIDAYVETVDAAVAEAKEAGVRFEDE